MAQEADSLRCYWRALHPQRRQQLLEGLPEAAALAGDEGDEGDGTGVSSCSGGGNVNLVQSLMLAPVAWCFKVRNNRKRTLFSCFEFFTTRVEEKLSPVISVFC